MPSIFIRFALLPVLAALLLAVGFVGNQVEQPQRTSDLVDRIDQLETAVAELQADNGALAARVKALEDAAAGEIDDPASVPASGASESASASGAPTPGAPTPPAPPVTIPSDWEQALSADNTVSYRYSPDWDLVADEPSNIVYYIGGYYTGRIFSFFWDIDQVMVTSLPEADVSIAEWETFLDKNGFGEGLEGFTVRGVEGRTVGGYDGVMLDVTLEDAGDSGRAMYSFFKCGPERQYSCGIWLMRFNDVDFNDRDWETLDAFAASIEFPNVGKAIANANTYLRSCPDVECEVVGRVLRGEVVDLIGQSADGGWYKLLTGEWIAAPQVDDAPAQLPVMEPDQLT